MKDRALQALVKLALEPEWEARFEPNSYGFRAGRSCYVNYLIAGSLIVDNIIMGTNTSLQKKADEMGTNSSQILPTSEVQVRPLAKLEPQQQLLVWQQAVEQAGGQVPPARIVKDIVQRIMEWTQVPNSYQIGEVCQILAKDNSSLRGKGGCWGIVNHVGEFSYTVKTWDGEYTVGL